MADEVGSKELEFAANEPEEDHYKVVAYLGSHLPKEFYNLIQATFKNHLRTGLDIYKLIDQDHFYEAYGKIVEALLNRPKAVIRIAMLKDRTVLGWSLSEDLTLHFVWVKKEQWHQGIGTALVPKGFDTITHLTNRGLNIWANKYPKARFKPFL